MVRKGKVYLGLSGGVDSAVAAAILLEEGYDVVPVFLKCWEDLEGVEEGGSGQGFECPWQEDQEAAVAVAEKLGIAKAFRSWNFTREFFETVIEPLIEEARKGRTGNPDVLCNRTIKFGAFFERALKEGADFVATGHYARLARLARADDEKRTPEGQSFVRYQLLRPRCEAKNDQTYFLWQLREEQLSRAMFPIGDFPSKEAVREEARKRGLPSSERRSTRGICFVNPREGYAGFLKRFLRSRVGDIVTTHGDVVGRHDGVAFVTLGQRQGIGIVDGRGPYYVVAKNEKENLIIVAPPAEAQRLLWKRETFIGEVNWISGVAPPFPLRCSAFIRHPQRETVPCRVEEVGGGILRVTFDEPQYALTPGQSVVLYDGDVVVGGGIIQQAS
jgi:tRNA-specific 2-thiouridylase